MLLVGQVTELSTSSYLSKAAPIPSRLSKPKVGGEGRSKWDDRDDEDNEVLRDRILREIERSDSDLTALETRVAALEAEASIGPSMSTPVVPRWPSRPPSRCADRKSKKTFQRKSEDFIREVFHGVNVDESTLKRLKAVTRTARHNHAVLTNTGNIDFVSRSAATPDLPVSFCCPVVYTGSCGTVANVKSALGSRLYCAWKAAPIDSEIKKTLKSKRCKYSIVAGAAENEGGILEECSL